MILRRIAWGVVVWMLIWMGIEAARAQASNFIPSAWYVREVPPNTINGKPFPAERVPEGQPQAVWWFINKELGGFYLEPVAGGTPRVHCTSVDGTAEVENPPKAEGIMRFQTMTYSGCTGSGYCAAGEATGLEQQMPVTSSGVYIVKGYAHSHDAFRFHVLCNGLPDALVSGPPLNLFWNEQSDGTWPGTSPNLILTDTEANNIRYWEPAAGLGEVNELELGELTDSLTGKEMTIRGQLEYLGDDEDIYTISWP